MKPETLLALQKSIAHWEEMAKNGWENEKPNRYACALCTEFYKQGCEGCPVKEKTGQACCFGSPYHKAYRAYVDRNLPDFKTLAAEELDFLRSLLPKEEPTTNILA